MFINLFIIVNNLLFCIISRSDAKCKRQKFSRQAKPVFNGPAWVISHAPALCKKKENHIDVEHIYAILRKKFGICLVVLSKTSHPQTNIGVKPCCLSEMPKVCIPSNHVLCWEYKIRLMHAERVGFLQKRWSRKNPVIFL